MTEGTDPQELEQRLAELQPDADKALERATKNEKSEINVKKATLDLLKFKKNREYPLYMPHNTEFDGEGNPTETEYIEFKVRRPSDQERLEFLSMDKERLSSLTKEEREEVDKSLYKFLEKVVTYPKASWIDWRDNVDQATLKFLISKIMFLAAETDDGKIFDFFTMR